MGGLFPKAPKIDMTPQKPAPMPDDQSPAVLEARRNATRAAMARGGRTSTILTGAGDRAAPATAYTGRTLG
jgi:hypothetical protein